MKIGWIIEAGYIEQEHNNDSWNSVIEELQNEGFPIKVINYKSHLTNDYRWDLDDVNIIGLIGTIGFVKNYHKFFQGPPLYPLFDPELHYYSRYQHKIEKNYLLNTDGFILPFVEISKKRQLETIKTPVFLRPDQALKVCEAEIVSDQSSLYSWISDKQRFSGVQDTTFFWLFPKKELGTEYRFAVVDKEVVSGSVYVKNGKVDISEDVHKHIFGFARYVAKEKIELNESSYILDVVETKNKKLKIVELNSLSTSSYYAMDIKKILLASSKVLINIAKEWEP